MKPILLTLLLVPTLAFAAASDTPKKQKPAKSDRQKANATQLFKKLDTNTDGHLTLEEFKSGPKGRKDPAKAEEFYKKVDKDSDGKLTLEEFRPRAPKKSKPAGAKPKPKKGTKPKTEV
jgi:EF-hand domain pair